MVHWADKLFPNLRTIESPVARHMLRPLDDQVDHVQFTTPLTPRDFTNLSAFMRDYPDRTLRVFGWNSVPDLEFLREFTFLRRFFVDVWTLQSLDGLRHLSPDLECLKIGATKKRTHSLQVLSRFPRLHELYIEGHTRDFAVVGTLKHLEKLTLRSVTRPDLLEFTSLRKLWWLDLKLGGSVSKARPLATASHRAGSSVSPSPMQIASTERLPSTALG